MKHIALDILGMVSGRGVQFADVRITAFDRESWSFVRGSLKSLSERRDGVAIGLRVLIDGAWGFAGTSELGRASLAALVDKAVANGRAASAWKKHKVEFAKMAPFTASRIVAPKEDPFLMSREEKTGYLLPLAQLLTGDKRIVYSNLSCDFWRQYKIYANTEGTIADWMSYNTDPTMEVLASNGTEVMSRAWPGMLEAGMGGFEVVREAQFAENAQKIIDEAIALLDAPRIEEERADIIIGGGHLALQLHESVGHATEADRIFGMEISYAGKTFVKPEHIGSLRYGSEKVTIVSDSTDERGMGWHLCDDDGVPARRVNIITNGILTDLQTSRETAPILGLEPSSNMKATHGFDYPLIRMTNLNLLPGDAGTLNDLIASTERGYLLDFTKTWSIDDSRNNFQFTTEIGWKIEKGRITGIVKEPTYFGITTEFWNSCDAVCGEPEWRYHGVFNCGKGEPGQLMRLSHGVAPARFKNVVVNVKA